MKKVDYFEIEHRYGIGDTQAGIQGNSEMHTLKIPNTIFILNSRKAKLDQGILIHLENGGLARLNDDRRWRGKISENTCECAAQVSNVCSTCGQRASVATYLHTESFAIVSRFLSLSVHCAVQTWQRSICELCAICEFYQFSMQLFRCCLCIVFSLIVVI